jgi:hypothetical protein
LKNGRNVVEAKSPEESRMVCPACGHGQQESAECLRCGIVISKYRQKAEQPDAISPEPDSPSEPGRSSGGFRLRWVMVPLAAVLIIFLGVRWYNNRPVVHGPGIVAPNAPVQDRVEGRKVFRHKKYVITALADFEVQARVLSKKRYRSGREAELAPVDLALGWGPMSDEAVLEKIKIRQSNRFYYWSVARFPIPRGKIENNSANMHLIPSTPEIRDVLLGCRRGQVVHFNGYLVRINATDGWRWKSSMTRKDTGDGACEVVWVEDIEII